MNTVILIGNITKDPEYHSFIMGGGVCNLSLAVSRDYTDKDGNKETDFFNVKVFGKSGENCNKFLKKGNKIAIYGKIENRSYLDKDNINRIATEIIANNVEFLTPKQNLTETESEPNGNLNLTEIDDNQLPF